METRLRGVGTEVIIGPEGPTKIIGDRIRQLAGEELADALRRLDLSPVRQAAQAQAEAGADVILVGIGVAGLDEKELLPLMVQAVAGAVSQPLCIDTEDPAALAAAMEVCPGKPLVRAISGRERALEELLPLAVRRGAAVIGAARDEAGVPQDVADRVELSRHVLRMAITAGIPREDVLLDPLAPALADQPNAALATLETIARLARIEAVNVALRPASISAGLPDPAAVAKIFLALALRAGATCLIADPVEVRGTAKIADALLNRKGG